MSDFMEEICGRCRKARKDHNVAESNTGAIGWFCKDKTGMGFRRLEGTGVAAAWESKAVIVIEKSEISNEG